MRVDEELVHYTIASTLFITLYPFIFIYFGFQNLTPEEKIDQQSKLTLLIFLLPILFGLIFALSYKVMTFIPRKMKNIYLRFIIAGAWTGFLISVIMQYVFHVQDRWLKMENPEVCHLFAPVFYFVLFYTLGVWMRQQILYGPVSTSSPVQSPGTANSVAVGSKALSATRPSVTATTGARPSVSTYDKLAQMAKSS